MPTRFPNPAPQRIARSRFVPNHSAPHRATSQVSENPRSALREHCSSPRRRAADTLQPAIQGLTHRGGQVLPSRRPSRKRHPHQPLQPVQFPDDLHIPAGSLIQQVKPPNSSRSGPPQSRRSAPDPTPAATPNPVQRTQAAHTCHAKSPRTPPTTQQAIQDASAPEEPSVCTSSAGVNRREATTHCSIPSARSHSGSR